MAVSVVVEDGSGVAGANSYLSVAAWRAYADATGKAYVDTAGETYDASDDEIGSALIRGTRAIDGWIEWPGVRANGRSQGLAWPRKAGSIQYGIYVADGVLTTVTDAEGLAIEADEIPQQLLNATAEAAWRELMSPGSLAPDLERGGAIKSVKAGSVEVVYADGAPMRTVFSTIDTLLSGLVACRGGVEVDLLRV